MSNKPTPISAMRNMGMKVPMPAPAPTPAPTYHEKAQKFIKSAKSKGMTVQAENGELIAYPKGMTPKKPR